MHSGNVRGYSQMPIRPVTFRATSSEITALIHEYAFRLDAGDFDGVAALFAHAELRSTRHERVRRGSPEARTLYDSVIVYDDGTPRTMHQTDERHRLGRRRR